MAEVTLTNEADYLLCSIYKGYLEKRKSGVFREDAVIFGNAETVQEDYAQLWPVNDIEDAVRELSRANLVACMWADNTFWRGCLTTGAIVYMENRFQNNLDKLLQRITVVKSLLLK